MGVQAICDSEFRPVLAVLINDCDDGEFPGKTGEKAVAPANVRLVDGMRGGKHGLMHIPWVPVATPARGAMETWDLTSLSGTPARSGADKIDLIFLSASCFSCLAWRRTPCISQHCAREASISQRAVAHFVRRRRASPLLPEEAVGLSSMPELFPVRSSSTTPMRPCCVPGCSSSNMVPGCSSGNMVNPPVISGCSSGECFPVLTIWPPHFIGQTSAFEFCTWMPARNSSTLMRVVLARDNGVTARFCNFPRSSSLSFTTTARTSVRKSAIERRSSSRTCSCNRNCSFVFLRSSSALAFSACSVPIHGAGPCDIEQTILPITPATHPVPRIPSCATLCCRRWGLPSPPVARWWRSASSMSVQRRNAVTQLSAAKSNELGASPRCVWITKCSTCTGGF